MGFKARVLKAIIRKTEDAAFEMNSLQTKLNELFPAYNQTLFPEAAGKEMNVYFWLDSDHIPGTDYEHDESREAMIQQLWTNNQRVQ